MMHALHIRTTIVIDESRRNRAREATGIVDYGLWAEGWTARLLTWRRAIGASSQDRQLNSIPDTP